MDEAVLRAINGLARAEFFAVLGRALSSRWLMPVVLGPLFGFLLFRRRYIAIASVALAMGAGDLVASRVLKPTFNRLRPCHTLEALARPVRCGSGKSLPSAHATVAFAFLVPSAPLVRRGWWMFGPLAAAVAASRVLLGVHYPSDVLAGAVLGTVIGAVFLVLRIKWETHRKKTRA